MKPFVFKLGCFLMLQGVVLILVSGYGSRDATSNDYLYSLKDKEELLRTTPSPRIIFAGGSNLAFGLNSEIVKQETGLNPVNLGLHGRLGIYPLLRMLKKHLRPGDTVVLAPEYAILFRSPKCAHEIGLEAYRAWPGCREFIQPDFDEPLPNLVPSTSPLKQLANSVYRARRRLGESGKDAEPQDATYQRNSFNEFGDHVAHYRIPPGRFVESQFQDIDENCFHAVAAKLNEFHKFCQSCDCRVVLSQAPIPASSMDDRQDWGDRVQRLFERELEIPVITHCNLMTFDDDLFYDSASHLTQRGAEIRTRILCEQIQRNRMADRGLSGNSRGHW